MGALKKFLSNCACPKGAAGKLMLAGMTFGHRWISAWGMKHLDGQNPADIVELGCGSGANAVRLLEAFPDAHLTGVDISPLSVDHARRKLKSFAAVGRCEVVQADVAALPFADGAFDLATAFETVYFWPGPLCSFKETARVLRPGGTFLIVNEVGGHEGLPIDWTRWVEGMKYYSASRLVQLLEEAGFAVERVDRRPKLGWLCVVARKDSAGKR